MYNSVSLPHWLHGKVRSLSKSQSLVQPLATNSIKISIIHYLRRRDFKRITKVENKVHIVQSICDKNRANLKQIATETIYIDLDS